jgi:formylglycine-generating enzyme required for sulfatase activity
LSKIVEIITDQGERLRHTELPLLIGSSDQAAIRLPGGPGASAWLAESDGFLYLQPADGAQVLHNRRRVEASVWLKSGDQTRIGNVVLTWMIEGDLIEARISHPDSVQPPPEPPPTRPAAPLPRVEAPPARQARKGFSPLYLLVLLLVLLCGAALFLLTAKRIVLEFAPEPESVHLQGFPPAVHFGDTFLVAGSNYELTALRQGYQPLHRALRIRKRENRFAFQLEKLPGMIRLRTQPEQGVLIRVDDKEIGRTPLEPFALGAGKHRLAAGAPGYRPLEQVVTVTGMGRTETVALRLEPNTAHVTLASEPAGAEVREGESVLGVTPLTVELASGAHRLRFVLPRYTPAELALDVRAGQDMAPDPVRLEPAPVVIHLKSMPARASVVADGQLLGVTPLDLRLQGGKRHRILVRKPGHAAREIVKTWPPGSEEEVLVRLAPQYGTLLLATDPVEATLLIDGRKHAGPATGRLRLTAAAHVLEVSAPGYETARREVHPQTGSVQEITIRLKKKGASGSSMAARPDRAGKGMIGFAPVLVHMGSPRREPGRRANEQERTVRITRPFALSARLVSNGEFRRFRPGHRSGSVAGHSLDLDNQPVVKVSWQDAAAYCNWLSRKEGLPPFYREEKGKFTPIHPFTTGFRLPSEAEWSYAARMAGRSKRARYPWPGKFPPRDVVGNFGDESARALLPVVIRGYSDGYPVSSPVGAFPKNPAGLFDMGGNVSQWCQDWYTPYTGLSSQDQASDSMGPASGTHHVVRGASWRDATMTGLRLSFRGYSKKPADDIGFRVARYLK